MRFACGRAICVCVFGIILASGGCGGGSRSSDLAGGAKGSEPAASTTTVSARATPHAKQHGRGRQRPEPVPIPARASSTRSAPASATHPPAGSTGAIPVPGPPAAATPSGPGIPVHAAPPPTPATIAGAKSPSESPYLKAKGLCGDRALVDQFVPPQQQKDPAAVARSLVRVAPAGQRHAAYEGCLAGLRSLGL